jgi:hypothetical protein
MFLVFWSQEDEISETCNTNGKMRNVSKIKVGKPNGIVRINLGVDRTLKKLCVYWLEQGSAQWKPLEKVGAHLYNWLLIKQNPARWNCFNNMPLSNIPIFTQILRNFFT